MSQFAAFVLSPHTAQVDAAVDHHRRRLAFDTEQTLLDGFQLEQGIQQAAADYAGGAPGQYALTDSTTMGIATMYGGLSLQPGDEVLSTTHDFYSTEESLRLWMRPSRRLPGWVPRLGPMTRTGTHEHTADPRNDEILIWVNGELRPRAEAVVSVFDSGFVLGDGVWEGIRVSGGHPVFLERHLDRLWEGAKAIVLDIGMSRDALTAAIYDTIRGNDMTDGVHIRLMVTRGVKSTPYQDPRVTVGPATVVIIAEHKEPMPSTVTHGITLFTTHVRRATPDTLDPKLNAHSKLNDIAACIQAYTAGADEALMLDPHGFVATCNSTHFFCVVARDGEPEVWTSDGRFCLGGITRGNVLRVCRDAGITARETTFSLTDVYSASEAFVTGTFAGVVPVTSVDGRTIGAGRRGPVVERLQGLYADLVAADVRSHT
jgi:branched-chain amino acid aminotransferase